MDLYAKNEKALRELHDEIVKDIRTVLKEKGYTSGRVDLNDRFTQKFNHFDIQNDRLIVNGWHTDNIDVNDLLKCLRNAYHVLPKFDL